MSFDLFQSRRNYNEKCVWWSRDERNEYLEDDLGNIEISNSDELIMRRTPSGYFMAKQENAVMKRENTLYNIYSTEKTTTTVKTPDNVEGIKQKDLVLFRGEKWIVAGVQKVQARVQQREFASDKNCSHYYYIELRK